MAVLTTVHSQAQVSGLFETKSAEVALTPEMFELLSSGIYEDRILAIVRELSCNGRDGEKEFHEQAGKLLRPAMEIHCPNSFEPHFYVRDYGTGMTHEQIFDTYLTFGKSTKTGSNDFIGQFGIGSKSPLSYSDSFIVTSYTDGKEIQYNIYKDNGIPKITKLIERESDEPSGLKVQVAVRSHDFYSFAERIKKFFKLFDYPVDITGKEIDTDVAYTEKNADYQIVDNYDSGVFAIMGGVPYQLSNEVRQDLQKVISVNTILLPFDIGSLNIASSRENLSFNEGDATDTAIKARVEHIKKSFFVNMQADIDTCETIAEAFKKLYEQYNMTRSGWGSDVFSFPDAVIKGETLPQIRKRFSSVDGFRAFEYNSYNASRVQETEYKTLYKLGFAHQYHTPNFVIFLNDKPKGGIKCAKAYAVQERKVVLFNPSEEQIELMTEVYGELPQVSCTAIYDTYCPKVATVKSAYTKVSGVYKATASGSIEVTQVDGTETGFYAEMVRDTVYIGSTPHNRATFSLLIEAGVLKDIYLIRKTSAKKNRPVGLKLLTADIIKDILRHKLNKKFIKQRAMRIVSANNSVDMFSHSELKQFNEYLYTGNHMLSYYSMYQKKYRNNELIVDIAKSFGVSIEARVQKHIKRVDAKINEELNAVKAQFQFAFDYEKMYSWNQTAEGMKQICKFVQQVINENKEKKD